MIGKNDELELNVVGVTAPANGVPEVE